MANAELRRDLQRMLIGEATDDRFVFCAFMVDGDLEDAEPFDPEHFKNWPRDVLAKAMRQATKVITQAGARPFVLTGPRFSLDNLGYVVTLYGVRQRSTIIDLHYDYHIAMHEVGI